MKIRTYTIISLVVVVPLGFYLKAYKGPAADWVNNSFDGALYEIFWCLLLSLFLVHAKPRWLALSVLAGTCALEFMQLWHPPLLEMLRSHFLGAVVLGTTFDWTDFPYYFLGSGLGWLWLERLRSGSY